jgi:hypothetical protein
MPLLVVPRGFQVSEYQYYEFLAVDKPLDERQQAQVRALSTRAHITSTSFVNEYHWGDFRGRPDALMKTHYDAFLYYANFGSRRLMLRLPRRLLDLDVAESYCPVEEIGDNLLIDLESGDESGDWDGEAGHGRLASIIGVRAELASGDLRALYLAWLLAVQDEEIEDDEVEPPVPANLGKLSASLTSLVDFLRIDEDLLAIAAAGSEQATVHEPSEPELVHWIAGLPEDVKDAWMLRVAKGDQVQVELMRAFRGESKPAVGTRTAGELLAAAHARRSAMEMLAEQKKARERALREEKAAVAREARLDELAFRTEEAWSDVSDLIDTKKPADYDRAVTILRDLRAVEERTGEVDSFVRRFLVLRQQHLRKPSLMQRFERARLTAPG